jgi:hypothetical protein
MNRRISRARLTKFVEAVGLARFIGGCAPGPGVGVVGLLLRDAGVANEQVVMIFLQRS